MSFLSIQQFPSVVINLLYTADFLLVLFRTSLMVFHVFLQSFLYRSNLFLKYDFLEVLITCVSLFLNLL